MSGVMGQRIPQGGRRFLSGAGLYVENLPFQGRSTSTFVRSPYAHARIIEHRLPAAVAKVPGTQVFTAADVDARRAPAAAVPRHRSADGPALHRGATSSASPVTSSPSCSPRRRGDGRRCRRARRRRLRAAAGRRRPRRRSPATCCSSRRSARTSARVTPEERRRGALRRLRGRRLGRAWSASAWRRARSSRAASAAVSATTGGRRCGSRPRRLTTTATGCGLARPRRRPRCASSAPDVGGGFGAKGLGVEDVLVAWLARETRPPVRWTETRSENMVAMHHGRARRSSTSRSAAAATATVQAYRPELLQDARRLPGHRRRAAELHRADGERRLRDPEDRGRDHVAS